MVKPHTADNDFYLIGMLRRSNKVICNEGLKQFMMYYPPRPKANELSSQSTLDALLRPALAWMMCVEVAGESYCPTGRKFLEGRGQV